jgi:hypothetical protein
MLPLPRFRPPIQHRKLIDRTGGLLAGALILGIVFTARADIVYLKDGTVLNGKVVNQKETINDPESGLSFPVSKAGGFFAITDGTRVIIFSPRQLDPARLADETNIFAAQGPFTFQRAKPRPTKQMPPGGEFTGKTKFNEFAERTLDLKTYQGYKEPIRQRLTYLSPYQLRLDAVDFTWQSHFLTTELDPEELQTLLFQFPELKEAPDKPDIEKRMKAFRFLVMANRFDMAEKELDRALKDIPASKERIDEAREALKQARAETALDDANRALSAGQLRLAQAFLQRVPQGLNGNLNVQAIAAGVKIKNIADQLEQARRYLRSLPDEAEGQFAESLVEAAAQLRGEIYYEGLDRLEPFLSLAEQAEAARKQNREPSDRPEELLARAVSGWLLGKELSEGKPARAAKLWRAREFALENLRTPDARARNQLLATYQKNDPIDAEEMARVVAMLPPPEPGPIGKAYEPVARRTSPRFGARNQVDYSLLLPPEYSHGRPYPVLFVMPHKNEKPSDIVKRYGYHALRNGYILAGVDWSDGLDAPYGYSSDEHLRVLNVLRELSQQYNVDTDRVFISGFGEGANAAWDIGLSHPDVFAGVVPVSSQPKLSYTLPYWPNAQNLPFYIVTGDVAGDAPKTVMRVFQEWLAKGYPAMHVIYRGRGTEWYGGELPFIFDWMSKKKRAACVPDMGKPQLSGTSTPETYMGMRNSDSRFFWLSSDSIDPRYLYENKPPKREALAARFQGQIRAGNQIVAYAVGAKQLNVWLAPGMVDFTRPVQVTVKWLNQEKMWKSPGPIKPSLSVLLDDLYERGDRRRVFVAQIKLNP